MSLVVEDICVRYGRRQVLENVTIPEIPAGHVVGLLGANAAGKSTLIKTIAGVLKPASGASRVLIDGRELKGREHRNALGYVPQDLLATAALTVFESILIAGGSEGGSLRLRGGGVARAGSLADAAAAVLAEVGIEHLAHRYLSELSGGQRQLAALAQMLVRNPHVMLLDEPTSALDLKHQVHVLELVRRRAREHGAVGLVAIHDLNLASRYCDQLVVLNQGTIMTCGAPCDVVCPTLLEAVYGFQARVLDDAGVPVVCPVAAG